MAAAYDIKMSDEEFQDYLQSQQEMQAIVDLPMQGEEMARLEETECQINGGDVEDNSYSLLTDFDDNDDTSEGDSEEEDEADLPHPKDTRDLAEGKNLNNSFIGSSYPENWDHLHIDKGQNPQFMYLNDPKGQPVENNIFDLAAKLF